ncbi:MAG: ABC transporter ATP-binding protein [Spirochaetaceae bacterium]|nr:ABC transporter ATP-binding protein [Spirochaetaceae bacterium]
MNVLSIENLTKIYRGRAGGPPTAALEEVSLSLTAGDFTAVMGPSGSGKTTLLNLVATIDAPTSGRILVDGVDLAELDDEGLATFRRERLGFVFQDANLLDTMSLAENIALPLALARRPADEILARVDELAEELGIAAALHKYPAEVSGGQRQRAAAARAVAAKPALVLADEPTGALDSASSRDLLECFSGLNEKRGATILLVTHDPFAASWCKRVLFIKDGRLYTELRRGPGGRKELFDRVLGVLASLEGESRAAR